MSDGQVGPGEIVLEHASRAFEVRGDRGRTLKELLIFRRSDEGPPAVQALRDVSLQVGRGETVGIVGRNGAGKSSTLRVLAGIVPLDQGQVSCGGRIVSLLELGAGFGRDFTGRENIELNGALHGFSREEVADRIDRIVEFSELGEFIDVPVRTYSSGMFVRLGFSIAAHLDADVLLIDEVLAVGDEAFQRKCLRRIAERIDEGATLVLVSHDPGAIERVCERVVVLDAGGVAFDGPTADGLLFYHRMLGVPTGGGGTSVRRGGDRALEVLELALLDAGGRRTQVFRSGEGMQAEMRLSGSEQGQIALEVRDEQGRSVFRTEANASPGTVRFVIGRVALLGGDYDLAVGAGEEGHFDRVERFSVAAEPGGEGVVDLRGSWSAVEARAGGRLMTGPEQAIDSARAAVAAARARGEYADDLAGFTIEASNEITTERLLEWALIEPDPELVVSTRRLGAPITWFKRGLVRILRQHLDQLASQQTRFNHHIAIYTSRVAHRVDELEQRVDELEHRAGADPDHEPDARPPAA